MSDIVTGLLEDELLDVDGEALFGLAQIIASRLPFLIIAKQRERKRKDKRLKDLNISIHYDAGTILRRNYNNIAFLLCEALKRGASKEALALLTQCLYELGHLEKAQATLDEARANKVVSAELDRLQELIFIELGDHDSLTKYAQMTKKNIENLRLYEVSDYPDFINWCNSVEADILDVSRAGVTRQAIFRCCADGEIYEYKNTLSSTDLYGGRLQDLEVLGGNIPCASGKAYFDIGLIDSCQLTLPSARASKTKIVCEANSSSIEHCSGKYLIPSATFNHHINYFHTIAQIYSRLALTLKSEKFKNYRILLPWNTPRWGLDVLANCAIDLDRIHIPSKHSIVKVEEAVVLPMKWDICPMEIAAIREALGVPDQAPAKRVNYYMLRKNAGNNTRVLVNEDAFIDICKSRGFQVIDPLDYSIKEQIHIFRNAGVIVSSASSAVTNMTYSAPGLEIVMIMPKLYFGMSSADLAASCGHTMSFVFGDFLAGEKQVSEPHNPYAADPEMLSRLLDTRIVDS